MFNSLDQTLYIFPNAQGNEDDLYIQNFGHGQERLQDAKIVNSIKAGIMPIKHECSQNTSLLYSHCKTDMQIRP